MASKISILIAGGESVLPELRKKYPAPNFKVLFAGSIAEALNHAAEANIAVVDAKLPGGGLELCRRLRSDPVTSSLPMILRIYGENDHMQAITDARVMNSDTAGLIKAMLRLCPDLHQASAKPPAGPPPPSPPPEEDDQLFDDGPQTVLWRRPEAGAGEAEGWPPPPPVLAADQDLVAFTLEYAGYMNSLLEALILPDRLSRSETDRLSTMSERVLSEVDAVLNQIQSAINNALMKRDLDRMKVLSSAKNALYDKRQRMRPLATKVSTSQASLSPEVVRAAAAPNSSSSLAAASPAVNAAAPNPPPASPADGMTLGAFLSSSTMPKGKSELTLAAEAKATEKKAELHKPATVHKSPVSQSQPYIGSARRQAPTTTNENKLIIAVVLFGLLVACGAGYLIYKRKKVRRPVAAQVVAPQRPVMKSVSIQQTPIGIQLVPMTEQRTVATITYTVRWYVNNQLVVQAKGMRLRPENYKVGDKIFAEVTPSDKVGPGLPMSSSLLIAADLSSPPSAQKNRAAGRKSAKTAR